MSLQFRIEKIKSEFSQLPQWEDRYKKIIALGKQAPSMNDEQKTEEAKVKGCQSQVWLHANLNEQGQILFTADSDALLVKGLAQLLVQIYSGSTPEEILQSSPEFLKELGFDGNLSPSRANGLFAMLKQIRNFAVGFGYLLSKK